MTGPTWTPIFAKKIIRFLLIKESFEWKKKIYDQAPNFYISKKPVTFEVSRLSDFQVIMVTDSKNMVSRKTHLKLYKVVRSRKLDLRQKQIILFSRIAILLLKG